mmetsp:Transcript_26186/g.52513  ORF Transcript_26186/g.52513 Transcript_26186/m.52513 type:complete len:241 (-) Transcript_26186:119-841(-)
MGPRVDAGRGSISNHVVNDHCARLGLPLVREVAKSTQISLSPNICPASATALSDASVLANTTKQWPLILPVASSIGICTLAILPHAPKNSRTSSSSVSYGRFQAKIFLHPSGFSRGVRFLFLPLLPSASCTLIHRPIISLPSKSNALGTDSASLNVRNAYPAGLPSWFARMFTAATSPQTSNISRTSISVALNGSPPRNKRLLPLTVSAMQTVGTFRVRTKSAWGKSRAPIREECANSGA